jgi:hypothetical protein
VSSKSSKKRAKRRNTRLNLIGAQIATVNQQPKTDMKQKLIPGMAEPSTIASRIEGKFVWSRISAVKTAPIQVPAMVLAHQDYLRGSKYREFAGSFIRSAWAKSPDREWTRGITGGPNALDIAAAMQGERWCNDEANLLNIADLYHISESMLEVCKHAAEKLDDLERWGPEALPSMHGVLVFEKPLYVEDVWGRLTGYHAATWTRVDISEYEPDKHPKHPNDAAFKPKGHETYQFGKRADGQEMPLLGHLAGSKDDMLRAFRHESQFIDEIEAGPPLSNRWATSFNFYSDIKDLRDSYNAELNLREQNVPELGRWILSHFGAMFDNAILGPVEFEDAEAVIEQYKKDHPRFRENTEAAAEIGLGSAAEDGELLGEYISNSTNIFRIMYSIFAMMSQTITDVSEVTDKRLARRNLGKKRPPPMVTVIRLRHPDQHGTHDEATGNWLAYRSMVKAHWRRQHYGDGSVKRIFINRYIRGPEDAPFHQPARVTTLQR